MAAQPFSVLLLDRHDREVIRIADERDAIQKKTFTKWVNKHLKKAGRTVQDLFQDLQDGHNLLSLLEVLTGELLSRERGRMRFHKVQNCNAALQFLKYRKIKVVNIRPEDIVDGNAKLTLGLIWTIILHFQISDIVNANQSNLQEQQQNELGAREARNALLVWVRDHVKGYPGVACKDFSRSWRDGLAFNALLHRYRPYLVDFRAVKQRSNRDNLERAFSVAETEFGVTRLLDAEDVDTPDPDDKSILTYVSSLYDALSSMEPELEQIREARLQAYVEQAVPFRSWLDQSINFFHSKYELSSLREAQSFIAQCSRFRNEELPRKSEVKSQLGELFIELENLFINCPNVPIREDIQPSTLESLWRMMMSKLDKREQTLHSDMERCEKLRPMADTVHRSVLEIDLRLKNLRDELKQDELRVSSIKNPYEAKNLCDKHERSLREVSVTVETTMRQARTLRDEHYYDSETIYRSVLEVEQKFITVKRIYQEGIIAQLAGRQFAAEEKHVTKRTEIITTTRLLDRQEKPEDDYDSHHSTLDITLNGNRRANGSVITPIVEVKSYSDREHVNGNGVRNGSFSSNVSSDISGSSSEYLRNGVTVDLGRPKVIERSDSTTSTVSSNGTPKYYFGANPTLDNGHSVNIPVLERSRSNSQQTVEALPTKKSRSDSLKEKAEEILVQLQQFVAQVVEVEDNCKDFGRWTSGIRIKLKEKAPVNVAELVSVERAVEDVGEIQTEVEQKGPALSEIRTKVDSATAKSKGFTSVLNEYRPYMSTPPPPVYAKANELQTLFVSTSSDYDKLKSDLNQALQNIHCLKELVLAYQDNTQEILSHISRCELHLAESENLPDDKDGIERAKMRFQELSRQSLELQSQVERLGAIHRDIQLRTDNRADQVKKQYDETVGRWEKVNRDYQERMEALDNTAYVLHTLDQMHDWLVHKKKMVAVLGPISYDLAQLEHQKQQVDVLLDELRAQKPQRDRLHDEVSSLLLRSKDADSKKLVSKMSAIDAMCTELTHQLEGRGRQIHNAAAASQVFGEAFSSLEAWLADISPRYESMVQAQENLHTKSRLAQLDSISEELYSHAYLVVNAENAAGNLGDILGNSVTKADIDSKVHSAKRQYDDLKKRCELMKGSLETRVKQSKDFELACTELAEWIGRSAELVNRNKAISAQLDVLQHQALSFEEVVADVNRRESDYAALVSGGKELSSKASPDIAEHIQLKLQDLSGQWSELSSLVNDRSSKLGNAVAQAKMYSAAVDAFQPWLSKCEKDVAQMKPLSYRRDENAAQAEECALIREDIQMHSADFEQVQRQGSVLLDCCQTDVQPIKEQLDDFRDRWTGLNETTLKRSRSLEDIGNRLIEYEETLKSLQDGLAKCEAQVQEADQSPVDQHTMDDLNAIQDQIDSMKRQLDLLEDLETALVTDADPAAADAIHAEFEAVVKKHAEIEQNVKDSLQFLENATGAVSKFVEYLRQTEHLINDLEDELDNLAPEGNDQDTIQMQLDEMAEFEQNIDATVKEVQDAESTLNDLEHNGYVTSSDDYKNQIENMYDQLENLALRTQNRVSGLNNARDKLEDYHRALKVVMFSLSHGEEDDGRSDLRTPEVPAAADPSYLHNQFFRRLDGMVRALNSAADKLASCEPISALPGKLQKQIEDNTKLIEDLGKRSHSYDAAKRAAVELSKLASDDESDSSIKEINHKLADLDDMWAKILKDTEDRGRSLEDTYNISVRFWQELDNVTSLIKELEDILSKQDPPAVEVNAIKDQQSALQELKDEFQQSQPEYEQCLSTGQELMNFCGAPDKPEVKKNIEELDHAWGNITQLFLQRETDLGEAMEKSMTFHGLLQNLMTFLEEAEDKFAQMGSIGADTDVVKGQMEQLKEFRSEMEPHTVEVESLITQADELIVKTSAEQAMIVSAPVDEIKQRWDMLCDDINERQYELENALVQLGQFRHAVEELMSWITEKDTALESWTIPSGDPKTIELEIAKHKGLMNDLFANQNSIDILNDAGRRIIEGTEGGEDASATQSLLDELNNKWQELLHKAELKQSLLEERLRDAEGFYDEIQEKLNWLAEKDQVLMATRPVGGLPQTAKDQLTNFMELFNELDGNKAAIDSILKRGQEFLEVTPTGMSASLDHNLKTLKHRWEGAVNKANDRKIKLEIAVRDAVEFYESLQNFTQWLTNAERTMSVAKPPSRIMDIVLQQIEEHKVFQEDLGEHLSQYTALDKKGTTLKYFSNKQDIAQIRNLLVSVQQRWDKLISSSADRQRSLNAAYVEGKEFNKHYVELSEWIDTADKVLVETMQQPIVNDAEKIRQQLNRHREFVKQLAGKQSALNGISKMGRILKESAAKSEQATIQGLLTDVQKRWKNLSSKAAERQRKLEESLLFCGQFNEALQSMIDWLRKVEPTLSESTPVFGDLDTVKAFDETHKALESDLASREESVAMLKKAAFSARDSTLNSDVKLLEEKWDSVSESAVKRRRLIDQALLTASDFHQQLHSLVEWLGSTEMKVRPFKALPDDVQDVHMAIFEVHEHQSEMQSRQANYESTLALSENIQSKSHPDALPTIRHWTKVLSTRWQEVELLLKQREQRLKEHGSALEKSHEELEKMLVWFFTAEANLTASANERLPEDLEAAQKIMQDHVDFENDLYGKQAPVERLSAPRPAAFDPSAPIDRRTGRTVPKSGRRAGEPVFPSDSAKDLYYRNKRVLELAEQRHGQLQDHLAYLQELEKLKNFQFDDWRRKFIRFMNVKKLRVMDFFRRLDRESDGRLTRNEFIDCILKSGFHTTPLEMERVADVFDSNRDGYIDYHEFLHALKPDWRSTQNLTDADKIEDEVTFQAQRCTCKNHFQVHHVGENRYIFGENQKLRLVRILRSTVMVRVGGGWIALDEFLVKNDPCRAKGRTNIELREQFILPEGASQSMTPFKSKSPGSNGIPMNSMGPITKIREKTPRSTPWKTDTSRRSTPSDTRSDPVQYNKRSHSHIPAYHNHSYIPVSGFKKPNDPHRNGSAGNSSQPTSRPSSRVVTDASEDPHSSLSHSAHSRSSSISNLSTPSTTSGTRVSMTKTPVRSNGAETNGSKIPSLNVRRR